MTLYILDAYALAELTSTTPLARLSSAETQNLLTDLAEAGNLEITGDTLTQLQEHLPQHHVTAWLRASRSSVVRGGSPYTFIDEVLRSCSALLDPNDLDPNPQVHVLALALQRIAEGNAVIVVTGENTDPPGRCSLETACVAAGVHHISPDEFATALVTI
ncbi:hypothetical protein [Demequina sp. NBRC 110053]|uniref:hypothetical protein n=1 Tax=Demequina sp. NBRC 110053 TaxID=1570342 RepID=UPI0009FF9099|nr:hypothetical protein [Demequina sp. NBRC 110053]